MGDSRENFESNSSEKASASQTGCCASSLMSDGLKNQLFNRQEAQTNDSLPPLNLFDSRVQNQPEQKKPEQNSGTA